MEGWRFLPCAAKSLDRRKLTRRRAELQLKLGDFFPPEGHVAVETERKIENELLLIELAITGGAKHEEGSTWEQGKELHILTLAVETNDITVNSIEKAKITGGTLPPLSSPAAFTANKNIYIFGGLNTSWMETSNEMTVLTPLKGKKGYDCTICKDFDRCRTRLPNDVFMVGDVPSERMGHTVNMIGDEHAILFRGVTFERGDFQS